MSNGQDFDNNINNFNQNNAAQQAKPEEVIPSNKPKISKKTASLIIQYGLIGFTVVGIFYKMFIEDTSGELKNKQPIQHVKQDETKTDFASAKIEQVKKSSISEKTEIKGLDTGYRQKAVMDVAVPSLVLPKVPEIKIEEPIEEKKQESRLENIKKSIEEESKTKPALLMPSSSPLEKAVAMEAKIDKKSTPLEDGSIGKKQQEVASSGEIALGGGQVNNAMGDMFLVKGSGGGGSSRSSGNNSAKQADGIIIFNGSRFSAVEKTEKTSQAQKIKNLSNTLLTGKLIEAVLETAINTQMPGTVRAVVSRDIYAESGSNVVIPAGSRLYGTYTSTLTAGDARVGIMWNRIIRPDAVSISISAQAVDENGRAGIAGDLDSGHLEMFKNSMLLSFISLGTAIATQKLFNLSGQTQVVNSNGSVATTNITPANAAVQNVVNLGTNVAKQMTTNLSQQIKPIITIDQGYKFHVVVNQDLTIDPYIKLSI